MIFKDVLDNTPDFFKEKRTYIGTQDYYVRHSAGVTRYNVRKTLNEKYPLSRIVSWDLLATLCTTLVATVFGYCTVWCVLAAVSASTPAGHTWMLALAFLTLILFIIFMAPTCLGVVDKVYTIRSRYAYPLSNNAVMSVTGIQWRALSDRVSQYVYFIQAIDAKVAKSTALSRAICDCVDAYFHATDGLDVIARDSDSDESARVKAKELMDSFARLHAATINSIIEEERRPQVEKENAQRQKKLEEAEAARIEAEQAAEQRREESARFAAKVLREAERKLQSEQVNVS